MRTTMEDNSLHGMLKMIINDHVFNGYNFDGTFNRKKLKSLQFFNKVIYGRFFYS